MPGGLASGLDRDGIVLLNLRRPFPAAEFRHYEYIGLLPDEWQEKLRAALIAQGRDIARESAKS
jgi:hypothetical protein